MLLSLDSVASMLGRPSTREAIYFALATDDVEIIKLAPHMPEPGLVGVLWRTWSPGDPYPSQRADPLCWLDKVPLGRRIAQDMGQPGLYEVCDPEGQILDAFWVHPRAESAAPAPTSKEEACP